MHLRVRYIILETECYNVVKNNSMPKHLNKWYNIKPNKGDNVMQDSYIEDYIDSISLWKSMSVE